MPRFLRRVAAFTPWFHLAAIGMAGLVLVSQPGCVSRRLLVRTDPPGAMVYVDEYEVGTTPVAQKFTYYGTRKIRLVKDGYETLTVMQPIRAPWYQIPPLDFITENLIPWKVRDYRELKYRMTPQMVVPTEQLLGRAESLRRGTYSPSASPENVMPAAASQPVAPMPPAATSAGPMNAAPPGGWRAPSG